VDEEKASMPPVESPDRSGNYEYRATLTVQGLRIAETEVSFDEAFAFLCRLATDLLYKQRGSCNFSTNQQN
jgi:hypothetical protein